MLPNAFNNIKHTYFSPLMTRYLGKQFLLHVLVVFLGITLLVLLGDILELLRRASSRNVPFGTILQMAILKFPKVGLQIIPFTLLVATVLSYMRMSRTRELVILRSAGVSVWQFLLPAIISALLIGILVVTTFNPLSSVMLSKYEQIETNYLHGRQNTLNLSQSGLWLRQRGAILNDSGTRGETIIHATDVEDAKEILLKDVIIFVFQNEDELLMRIDAAQAQLMDEFWHLRDVFISRTDGTTNRHDEYFLQTDLTENDIHQSFASPDTISFWALPAFIDTLQKSGFSALSHKLHWHTTLSSPLFYLSMVLIAALFSLGSARHLPTGLLITGSILCGFLIYFLTQIVWSFGLSGVVPVSVAAWAPTVAYLLIGVSGLLHLEDG